MFSNGTSTTLNFEDLCEEGGAEIPNKYKEYDTGLNQYNQWKLPQIYNEKEIFLLAPTWEKEDSMQLNMGKLINRLDNISGIFQYDKKNNKTTDIIHWDLNLMDRKEINIMIKFFINHGGKWKSFYIPSWANDIQIALESKGSHIYTDFKKMNEYYSWNERKKKIVIFYKNYTSEILEILSYSKEKIGGKYFGKIQLSKAPKNTLSEENVLMISYLNRVRFDMDSIELNYESNLCAKVALEMIEVGDAIG